MEQICRGSESVANLTFRPVPARDSISDPDNVVHITQVSMIVRLDCPGALEQNQTNKYFCSKTSQHFKNSTNKITLKDILLNFSISAFLRQHQKNFLKQEMETNTEAHT